MKYLFTIISFFIVTNCFAIDQKLIDGAKQYDAAVANLHKILEAIDINSMSLDEFIEKLRNTTDNSLPEEARTAARNKIDEKHKRVSELNLQYAEAEAVAKKLEPLKKEYDRQKRIKNNRLDLIKSIIVFVIIALVFMTFFGFIIRLAITQHKKYKKLLKEEKITQEEYDRIMKCRKSKSMFSGDLGINPSTGLPLIGNGVCDAGGNLRGSSPIRSSFDYSQDYSSRHRWE